MGSAVISKNPQSKRYPEDVERLDFNGLAGFPGGKRTMQAGIWRLTIGINPCKGEEKANRQEREYKAVDAYFLLGQVSRRLAS
jgi:hypothetical protein